ncbi:MULTISPECIES: hypothetical protein [Amycolatopsis]|nr:MULTISPECIES: hypothetical protein [Amycolatopsis]
MYAFLMIAKVMGPLLVLMLCPIWLPMIGVLVGRVFDAFSGKG